VKSKFDVGTERRSEFTIVFLVLTYTISQQLHPQDIVIHVPVIKGAMESHPMSGDRVTTSTFGKWSKHA
jgi:hypothetical protein